MKLGKKALLGFTSVVAALTVCVGCSGDSVASGKYIKMQSSVSDSSWEELTGKAVLENDNLIFELNSDNTHFNITDKRSGKVYTSVPADEIGATADETGYRMNSEITVRYYEQESDALYMYSDLDSVQNSTFTVKTDGTAIRVAYSMGDISKFIPTVLDKKRYKKLMDELGSDALRRRFERYYTLYSSSDKPDNFKEMAEKYPVLSSQSLYILTDSLSDIDKDDIADYISETSFSKSTYDAMLKELSITDTESNAGAGFLIPVEYKLTDDGFTANVLTDLIVESSDDYKLQSVDLLEYFSATDEENGNFFVPDGSGALIDFSTSSGEYSMPYYGEDYTINTETETRITKNSALPVFGITLSDGGIFGIVENAAETATLNVITKSDANQVGRAYTSFMMRSIDVTDYGAKMSIPIYNLFSKDIFPVSPKIRYVLLQGNANSYKDMANYYRNYLYSNGIMSAEAVKESPVYLDYLCMITEKTSMMGVPYTKKTVLSTVKEIEKSVKKIQDSGVGPCIVRLIGYGSGGYEHSVYNKFHIDKNVGTEDEVKSLIKLLEDNGGKLYFDTDMQFAFKNGSGFKASDDSARYLNRLVVCKCAYDIVDRKYDSDNLLRYFISPECYRQFGSMLRKSFDNVFGKNLPGLSYGSSGKILGGDYTKGRDIDRNESSVLMTAELKKSADSGFKMMFDTGNYYVLPYAEHILNVPSENSYFDIESESVPFYQMVLHGSISYAGSPQNNSVLGTRSYLDSIAVGGAPYAAFITRGDSLISNTVYETQWFSLSDSNRLDSFIKSAKSTKQLRNSTQTAQITDFETVMPSVTRTKFSNGVMVYVNSSDNDVTVEGRTIPSYSFAEGE